MLGFVLYDLRLKSCRTKVKQVRKNTFFEQLGQGLGGPKREVLTGVWVHTTYSKETFL